MLSKITITLPGSSRAEVDLSSVQISIPSLGKHIFSDRVAFGCHGVVMKIKRADNENSQLSLAVKIFTDITQDFTSLIKLCYKEIDGYFLFDANFSTTFATTKKALQLTIKPPQSECIYSLPGFVMPYYEMPTLFGYLNKKSQEGGTTTNDILVILLKIMEQYQVLIDRKQVHGDLHLENILYDGNQVKFCDFQMMVPLGTVIPCPLRFQKPMIYRDSILLAETNRTSYLADHSQDIFCLLAVLYLARKKYKIIFSDSLNKLFDWYLRPNVNERGSVKSLKGYLEVLIKYESTDSDLTNLESQRMKYILEIRNDCPDNLIGLKRLEILQAFKTAALYKISKWSLIPAHIEVAHIVSRRFIKYVTNLVKFNEERDVYQLIMKMDNLIHELARCINNEDDKIIFNTICRIYLFNDDHSIRHDSSILQIEGDNLGGFIKNNIDSKITIILTLQQLINLVSSCVVDNLTYANLFFSKCDDPNLTVKITKINFFPTRVESFEESLRILDYFIYILNENNKLVEYPLDFLSFLHDCYSVRNFETFNSIINEYKSKIQVILKKCESLDAGNGNNDQSAREKYGKILATAIQLRVAIINLVGIKAESQLANITFSIFNELKSAHDIVEVLNVCSTLTEVIKSLKGKIPNELDLNLLLKALWDHKNQIYSYSKELTENQLHQFCQCYFVHYSDIVDLIPQENEQSETRSLETFHPKNLSLLIKKVLEKHNDSSRRSYIFNFIANAYPVKLLSETLESLSTSLQDDATQAQPSEANQADIKQQAATISTESENEVRRGLWSRLMNLSASSAINGDTSQLSTPTLRRTTTHV
ncbi:MAG: protein kinase family protein [Legionellales bacterium]|nr:protein kinase family protein [Legionellales bacterium]